jgi:hypothetical protein
MLHQSGIRNLTLDGQGGSIFRLLNHDGLLGTADSIAGVGVKAIHAERRRS